uniref:Protein kinase domain-containing protein n=1 Tax=Angiostrongylus cantonensis TaxID=6313 RepID=A0A158P6E3_ANGCA
MKSNLPSRNFHYLSRQNMSLSAYRTACFKQSFVHCKSFRYLLQSSRNWLLLSTPISVTNKCDIQKKGRLSNTIVGRVGSDMMYRDCRFLYYAQSIASVQCGTRTEVSLPPANSVQTLIINCDTVRSSPCRVPTVRQPPVCVGDVLDPYDANYSLTLNVTFKPFIRQNEPPTIYYKALYGEAIPYQRKEEEAFVGVNITNITGFSGNCLAFDSEGFCTEDSGNSVIVDSIHFDKLYGITFCAVKDVNNAELPDILAPGRIFKPRANKIFVKSPGDFQISFKFYEYTISVGALEDQSGYREAKSIFQKGSRYIDFPKKHDIWEIERRNLIIFEEERLGSGAFGAVYLGKLLGKSCAHKNSNSPLGVNLMRAESCEVAVKMLPEYADDISRGEFLREIGLMKSLGYHERLVNMLACITESEPLCLVVEYCNDGDLLRFLRERCKYMLKLDANGVNYHEPPLDNNYDIDMVITLKQLLMFAVQISYGLEYISSKGFVHRDVAARNVLVHGKTSCKIGDFGLCRNLCTDNSHYKSKGGRLPVKWMSPEAIRHYEFSAQSDVWAFGVLLFEIITLGGSPYPSVPPEKMLPFLENGGRMERPDNCPENFYEVMCECWTRDPEKRPNFLSIRQKLAAQLEKITEEYSYLTLDARKDYYNFQYDDPKDISAGSIQR